MSITGYKVFNPDWTCRGKAYTCPGTFEEDVEPIVCESGMHFCKKAIDCFNYYSFDPCNHIAEVIAHGTVVGYNDKCCTNKLEIVREISWTELLELVNVGGGNTGIGNSGYFNSGYYNCGSRNSGHYNSGCWNSGNYNSGYYNSGSANSGYYNCGNYNSGDWNIGNYNNGCFNTVASKIYLFNKPSDWTFNDWLSSKAKRIMDCVPKNLAWVKFDQMTDEEKKVYLTAETTNGYLRKIPDDELAAIRNEWWAGLSPDNKDEILRLPNFDAKIFKKVTMIDVNNAAE